MMNKIKSRWGISVNKMNKKHISYLLNSNYAKSIIRGMVNSFINKNKKFSFDEIYSVASEGFWKAIKSYNPDKGKFGSYATYMCKAYINCYSRLSRINKEDRMEFELKENDMIVNNENDIDNKIIIDRILKNISNKSREILIAHYFLNFSKKESIEHFSITRPTLEAKLKKALSEAKKVALSYGPYIN